MKDRASRSSATLPPPFDGPPTFPKSFIEAVNATSPCPRPDSGSATNKTSSELQYSPTSADPYINPYIGKKVLVLSGGSDPLVPWKFSKDFVEELVVRRSSEGEAGGNSGAWTGKKEVIVEEQAKHEVTPTMIANLCRFVWEETLSV